MWRPEGKDYLVDVGVDGNIKMYFQKVRWRGMDWIDLVQDRDRWRALVNAVMNFRVHKMRGIS